jgi:hypothetical protein
MPKKMCFFPSKDGIIEFFFRTVPYRTLPYRTVQYRTVPQQTVFRSEKYRKINEKRHFILKCFAFLTLIPF